MRDEELVMAMPRRELYKVSGFTRSVDYAVLESLDQESWFARASALQGHPDAKEVRVGLVVTSIHDGQEQVLITEEGVLLHAAAIPPEVARFGTGLRAIRELARAAVQELVVDAQLTIELSGYINDDSMPECRDMFVLVYRVVLKQALEAPAGMIWVGLRNLPNTALDPVSSLVAPFFAPRGAERSR